MKKMLVVFTVLIFIFFACDRAGIKEHESTPNDYKPEEATLDITPEITPSEVADSVQIPLTEGYDTSFSWLDYDIVITPQNQDPYGTCAIFAAISIFESSIALETGELVDLSEQHFINNTNDWTADTGVSPEKVLAFLVRNGVVIDERLPYTGIKKDVELNPVCDYKLSSWGSALLNGYPLDQRIEIIKENLIEHGPIITNIALYDDMNYYKSGIYKCDETSGVLGGHWLTILGWVDDKDVENGGYWICKNSWGTQWGERGYCKMIYGDKSGIDDYILYYVDGPVKDPSAQISNELDINFDISLDYSEDLIVLEPQDQKEYSADVVFAAVSIFESAIAKATGTLPDLSEQHFIDNSEYWFDGNRVSPGMVLDFFVENGVVLDKTLPYTGTKGSTPLDNEYDYKLLSWGMEHLDAYSEQERISIVKMSLLQYGPVLTNIGLREDLYAYESGIYEADTSMNPISAHWITIIGWQDDHTIQSGGYWICKNSWGTDWGENGFCKIAYNSVCGIDKYDLYFVFEPEDIQ